MPKSRKLIKHSFGIRKYWLRPSFRIGTRKNGKSAHLYRSSELLTMLKDKTKTKWHKKIQCVLVARKCLVI